MQLFLDSFGAFLGVRNGQFFVRARQNGSEHLFATRQVDAIFMTKGTTATTDAYILALENDIPVLLIDGIGHPIGQVWSGKFGSISTIRRNQIAFAAQTKGWLWLAQFLKQKIEYQRQTLIDFESHYLDPDNAKRRLGRTSSVLQHLANQLDRWIPTPDETTDFDRIAATFRAWEATASRHYFRFLATVVPPQYQFQNRNFRPALDPFNCLLNYLYGILYAHVELALMKAGVDPYLGILHVDRYNRPTMVYDFIEPFRHWADRVALDLVFNDRLPADAFLENPPFLAKNESVIARNEATEGVGFWLAAAGKPIVISAFAQFMDDKITFRKQQQRRQTVLDMEAQSLAAILKKM